MLKDKLSCIELRQWFGVTIQSKAITHSRLCLLYNSRMWWHKLLENWNLRTASC